MLINPKTKTSVQVTEPGNIILPMGKLRLRLKGQKGDRARLQTQPQIEISLHSHMLSLLC